MSEKVRLVIAIMAAIVSTALTAGLFLAAYKYFDSISDLPEYVVAGHLIAEGRGVKIYDGPTVIAERKKLYPTLRDRPGASVLCPPPAFPLFLPFAVAPPEVMKVIWTPILALAAVASVLLLRNAYALSARATAWLWAVLFCLGPLFEAFKLNQISTVLLLALCSAIWLFKRDREFAAGAVLALFLFKPQELLTFMLFLIGAGRWRAVKGFATAVIASTLVSVVIVGLDAYPGFFELTRHLKELNPIMQPEITATVRGQLMRLHIQYDLVQAISMAVLVAASAFSFWFGRRQRGQAGWLDAGMAVTLPIGLTTAMLCHFYDLILLVPAGLALIYSPLTQVIPKYFSAFGMLIIMALAMPIALIVHYQWVLKSMPINPYALMMMAISIGLAVFACLSVARPDISRSS